MSNLRTLWVGASPWNNSGYGKPMRYLVPELMRRGYECLLAPFFGYEGPPVQTDVGGEQVWILPPGKDAWMNNIIEHHVAHWGIDVVISLCDAWILKDWGEKGFTWLPRFPVDTHPVSPPTLAAIEGCHSPLALTKFGQRELIEAGWETTRYIPHGVDLDIHQPMDRAEARRASGLPMDGFIAGMVAANSSEPSRKSFPEVLQAWRAWKDGGGEGQLYLHTTITPNNSKANGVDLKYICQTLDLKIATMDWPEREAIENADVLFPSQYRMMVSAINDESLAKLYNSFDVLLSPSKAEGFGIPIVEAQACGVPVITNHITSMPEITFAGKCLRPAQGSWCGRNEGVKDGGWRAIVDVDALIEAIDWAANLDAGERENLACLGRTGASQFGWDTLIEHKWLPLLGELEEWL